MIEAEFEEIINSFFDYPIVARVSYTATPAQEEGRYFTKHGFDIEVTDSKYFYPGSPIELYFEGPVWDELEAIALEMAQSHFFDGKEAA